MTRLGGAVFVTAMCWAGGAAAQEQNLIGADVALVQESPSRARAAVDAPELAAELAGYADAEFAVTRPRVSPEPPAWKDNFFVGDEMTLDLRWAARAAAAALSTGGAPVVAHLRVWNGAPAIAAEDFEIGANRQFQKQFTVQGMKVTGAAKLTVEVWLTVPAGPWYSPRTVETRDTPHQTLALDFAVKAPFSALIAAPPNPLTIQHGAPAPQTLSITYYSSAAAHLQGAQLGRAQPRPMDFPEVDAHQPRVQALASGVVEHLDRNHCVNGNLGQATFQAAYSVLRPRVFLSSATPWVGDDLNETPNELCNCPPGGIAQSLTTPPYRWVFPSAQGTTTVHGIVFKSVAGDQPRPAVGVPVQLTDKPTGGVFRATTDEQGLFAVSGTFTQGADAMLDLGGGPLYKSAHFDSMMILPEGEPAHIPIPIFIPPVPVNDRPVINPNVLKQDLNVSPLRRIFGQYILQRSPNLMIRRPIDFGPGPAPRPPVVPADVNLPTALVVAPAFLPPVSGRVVSDGGEPLDALAWLVRDGGAAPVYFGRALAGQLRGDPMSVEDAGAGTAHVKVRVVPRVDQCFAESEQSVDFATTAGGPIDLGVVTFHVKPAPAPMVTVSGRVVDGATGRGILAVAVTFDRAGGGGVPGVPLAAVTDETGAFSFPLPAGRYAVGFKGAALQGYGDPGASPAFELGRCGDKIDFGAIQLSRADLSAGLGGLEAIVGKVCGHCSLGGGRVAGFEFVCLIVIALWARRRVRSRR